MNETFRRLNRWDRTAYFLFWSWNLIFLAFMTLGFAPRILPEMILAVGTSAIPASFLAYALILTAIPIVTIILGLTLLRRAPARLFALGYAVEGPLMLMLAFRFFLIREVTPALTVLMTVAGLGMAAFMWHVLDPHGGRRGPLVGGLRLVGLTLMALTSLYAAVWIAFYALPLVMEAARGLNSILGDLPAFFRELGRTLVELFTAQLVWVPFAILGFILALYTATLFVLTPLAVPALSLRAWWQAFVAQVARRGWLRSAALAGATVVTCAAIFAYANRQPQQEAFRLLESPPSSLEAAQDLLRREQTIRAGLLNAYLAPFRYISAAGEVVHIREIYRAVFRMPVEEAIEIQRLYEWVARPLLYAPVHPADPSLRRDNIALRREPQEAAALYARFFDRPIVEGERETIVRAVRATWSINQAEAAWLAVDDREVYLLRQEINIDEHGDWAQVELVEVYQNQTAERQEVVYYFNLPESAVLTGVWLGETPERTARHAFQVAPRGAAQAVYRNETRVFRDPALLEQIGPRQYRLRVFPVPPMQTTWDEAQAHSIVTEAPPLYLWVTYRVMADRGDWPLPRLAYKRNVYWDAATTRLANDNPLEVDGDAWLPPSLPAAGDTAPRPHRADLVGGESVLALPVETQELPLLPSSLRLAVVLDRSRSMTAHAGDVTAALVQLQVTVGPEARVDLYLTASPFRGEAPSRVALADYVADTTVYFGGQNAAELLAQFEALDAGRVYDAVLVLTDGSGYELGEGTVGLDIPAAPVWMVHLGGDIPLGYDDQTLEAIQASGGGVVGELNEALERLAVTLAQAQQAGKSGPGRELLDGYLWAVVPTMQAGDFAPGLSPEEGFSPLAARHLILAHTRRLQEVLDQPETLDRLHDLALNYEVVSPYSSMIVLLTPEQQVLLDHLGQGADRYQREVEALADTIPSTPLPLTGVPEPHEWLLIGLAVAMLLWYASQRRPAWGRL